MIILCKIMLIKTKKNKNNAFGNSDDTNIKRN